MTWVVAPCFVFGFSLGFTLCPICTSQKRELQLFSFKHTNNNNRQLPRFEMFYWCIVIVSYSQDSLLLNFTRQGPESKTRSMLSFIGRQIYFPSSLSLSPWLTPPCSLFTRTLSCSVFVPLFLVHTLFQTQHTYAHTNTRLSSLFFSAFVLSHLIHSLCVLLMRFCDNSIMC